ncbi:Erp family outer-surface lipoprotein [Borreliella carolinensis]|uniref:Erp family outer-surface lipoprotein n=1 Tax=Borreliella carolinensis TaxID=478174 RepID=A0ACD5GL56_9SPIR
MNKIIKILIICAVFALISSSKNFVSNLSDKESSGIVKLSRFVVKIKNKDTSGNWIDLGTFFILKEKDGIKTVLRDDDQLGYYESIFFYLKKTEVNNFIKAMIKGGSFKTSVYYGYINEQSKADGIKNKDIITKIEKIDGTEYITFSGDSIKNSENKIAEYAIPLEELKNNLK